MVGSCLSIACMKRTGILIVITDYIYTEENVTAPPGQQKSLPCQVGACDLKTFPIKYPNFHILLLHLLYILLSPESSLG